MYVKSTAVMQCIYNLKLKKVVLYVIERAWESSISFAMGEFSFIDHIITKN